MRVLSLFDWIACGYEALQRAWIQIDKYYSSEIDQYAIQIAQKNHPDIIQLGDVNDRENWRLGGIDMIIWGSPCQGFSRAGKGLNFEDPRSKLFFEFVKIVRNYKPKYFLLENVMMKKERQDIISEQLGVKPIEINSSLVSAQNRRRLYWTNIPGIEKPKDRGILLKDILEENADLKYTLTEKQKSLITRTQPTDWGTAKRIGGMYNQITRRGIYDTEGQSPTITASMGMGGGHIPMIKQATKQGYIIAEEGDGVDLNYPQSKTRRGRVIKWKSNTLTTQGENHVFDKIIRKLTPVECERLQTLPDNYTAGVSDTQRYKALGNGRTVDVIAHIFRFIKD